jgi:uncharacterized protein (DUF58 family)
MLTAQGVASSWAAIRLLQSLPTFKNVFPESTQAAQAYVLRSPLEVQATSSAVIDVVWHADQQQAALQLRHTAQESLLTGRIVSHRRGVFHLRRQVLQTSAPLDLLEITHVRDALCEWVVLPAPIPWADMSQGALQRRHLEGDEWRDLRPYIHGDALSRVHWRKAAADVSGWTVKRFEAQAMGEQPRLLRVDLRLPASCSEAAFERLLGKAWFWLDARLKEGCRDIQLVLGQKGFNMDDPAKRKEALRAIAQAESEAMPPAGAGGVLLSLMEAS